MEPTIELEEEDRKASDDYDYVLDVFGADGLLSREFPAYEPRVGQIELAYAVADGMKEGVNVLAEAPTGTGKSLGYGVPATYRASLGEKVVIVTKNIALQEQIVGKDLPLLAKVLPWNFTFALAKGMGNYLCRSAFDESVNKSIMRGVENASDLRQWSNVMKWASATLTGDISELSFEPSFELKQRFTILSEECPGKKCAHYSDCFAIKARQRVRNAGVVVTNYALFFADFAIKLAGAEGVLPRYTHVVFDEGHSAADHARDFLGFRVTQGAIAYAVKLLDHKQGESARKGPMPVVDPDLKMRVTRASDNFFEALTSLYHSDAYKCRFTRPWKEDLKRLADELISSLGESSRSLSKAALLPGISSERALELHSVAAKCGEHASNIMAVKDFKSDEWVFYLEEENDRIALKGKPIDVSSYLRSSLFNAKTGENAVKSVTVTSATLATKVDDYSFISSQLGIGDAEKLTVLSPFNIEENTLIVCPPMPSPQDARWQRSLAERMLEAIQEAKGRTLCLFTSYRSLNAVFNELRGKCQYPLLKQGSLPRMQLIEKFKTDIPSVLLGTESFWAGVDVPGESLSQVVIDRLPFPNISDPLQDVLRVRKGKSYFNENSVPEAVIAFRQGCGRLLRTVADRGVITILDSRVTEKGYGKVFLRSFPEGTRIVHQLEHIGPFLEQPAVPPS